MEAAEQEVNSVSTGEMTLADVRRSITAVDEVLQDVQSQQAAGRRVSAGFGN